MEKTFQKVEKNKGQTNIFTPDGKQARKREVYMVLIASKDGNCLIDCDEDHAKAYDHDEFERLDQKVEKEPFVYDPLMEVPWTEQTIILPNGMLTTISEMKRKKKGCL